MFLLQFLDCNLFGYTQLKQLNAEERVAEIAEMIGGKQLTAAAKAHAESLLVNHLGTNS